MLQNNKKLNQKPRILFVVAASSYFMSHRFDLAKDVIKAGYDVALATQPSGNFKEQKAQLEKVGINVFEAPFHRSTLNPIADLKTVLSLFKVMKAYKPDILHNVALKPIVYGSLLGKVLKIPTIVNALGGFGYAFTATSFKARFVRLFLEPLLKTLLKKTHIIVQNQDDQNLVKKWTHSYKNIHLLRGAGVDTDHFSPASYYAQNHVITFVGRMLWSKGVGELVEAAKMLKKSHPHAVVQLVGDPDVQNPDHIPLTTLKKWHESGIIRHRPSTKDIAKIYQYSQIAVLPSYREGLPKSMLEAASCGLPLVTTDVIGCKELIFCNESMQNSHNIVQGENGFLVPAKDSKNLYKALSLLLNKGNTCIAMGQKSREYALMYWSKEEINQKTILIYSQKIQK